MRSLIPKSYDNKSCSIQFERYSPSSSWESDNKPTATIKVSYRPQVGVTSGNTYYKLNNSSGTSISKGQMITANADVTGIYVSWSYDTDAYSAGYTQGYRIRLYNQNNTIVKTYYTSNKYYTIPKADIPKIQNTYIDITPYYTNDSSSAGSYWYYSGSIEKMSFVYLTSVLTTPVITYPINNSNWINYVPRICFELPTDPDKGSEQETYHYENIEIMINNSFTIRMVDSVGQTTSGTTIKAPQCFNALPENLTYQRKIVICPSLASGFPQTSSYILKVRVKKKYGSSTSTTTWSNWSNVCNLSITIPSYSVNKNDYITAAHYNNGKAVVNRIKSTYSVSGNVPGDVTKNTTLILATQFNYNTLYSLLVDTKNTVNNYATFDSGRTNVKIDSNNALETSFNPTQGEYISASANDTTVPGRNYIKILYERFTKLI